MATLVLSTSALGSYALHDAATTARKLRKNPKFIVTVSSSVKSQRSSPSHHAECCRRTTNIASGHQDDSKPNALNTIDPSRTLAPGSEQPVRATDFASGNPS
jgi:hypothetical protein